MIGRKYLRKQTGEATKKGFDQFELRLGDVLRGERATMGKSLSNVQQELRIKAAYIAAVENADPSAFDTPGFVAGYVRSYARYLGIDPDWAFDQFCRESGFANSASLSNQVRARGNTSVPDFSRPRGDLDVLLASPVTPFAPRRESVFSGVEPGAIGSLVVLLVLVLGLSYGGWTVLQEVQRVQVAPVDETPQVVTQLDLDPLSGQVVGVEAVGNEALASVQGPTTEALDRLYRPQALETPVIVARDTPISSINPDASGVLAPRPEVDAIALADPLAGGALGGEVANNQAGPQVTEEMIPQVAMVAVRPAWVQVESVDGTVIYEAIMNAGDTFDVPQTEEPATLLIGESGAVYFSVNGVHYGPVGSNGWVKKGLALSADNLLESYEVADLTADQDLERVVAELSTIPAAPLLRPQLIPNQ